MWKKITAVTMICILCAFFSFRITDAAEVSGTKQDVTDYKQISALISDTWDDDYFENWYQPEDLIGRKIVFVANLAPAKLCGELSEGMILACDAGDNDVRVLFLDKDVPNGSTIR